MPQTALPLEIAIGGFTVKLLKKWMLATLAVVMLAGALSSISGVTSMRSLGPVAVVGEGSSPLPVVLSSVPDNDATSSGNRF
jgi:hypothetical protein